MIEALFTLIAAVLVAVVVFGNFLRREEERENGDGSDRND